MTRILLIASAVVAVILTWLAWDGLGYLQQGYSLQVTAERLPRLTSTQEFPDTSESGSPQAVVNGTLSHIFHVDFPTWRIAAHIFLWATAMAAIFIYAGGRPWAWIVAWAGLVATFAVGAHDVVQYGTLGSPTSIWTILLLLLVALLTTFRRLAPTTNA